MIHFLTDDQTLTEALGEILREIPNGDAIDAQLTLTKIEHGLSVTITDGQATLG